MPDTTPIGARGLFQEHWADCDLCQDGLPCKIGDPLWEAMHDELLDQQGNDPDA